MWLTDIHITSRCYVSHSTLDKKKHKQILLSWILPANVFKHEQNKEKKKNLNYVFFTVDCV